MVLLFLSKTHNFHFNGKQTLECDKKKYQGYIQCHISAAGCYFYLDLLE